MGNKGKSDLSQERTNSQPSKSKRLSSAASMARYKEPGIPFDGSAIKSRHSHGNCQRSNNSSAFYSPRTKLGKSSARYSIKFGRST